MKTDRSWSWRGLLVAVVLVFSPAQLLAQGGRIAGTVSDAAGATVAGAQVSVVGTGLGAISNETGDFAIEAVPAGVHALRVDHIAYRSFTMTDVRVTAGATTTLDLTLDSAPIELAGVVVSASRRTQKVTDAPATITRIGADELELAVGNNFSTALRDVKGLDFIQVGATSAVVNARGFNSSFNNRMLMLEDNRVSVLPESGLPVGTFTAIPRIDIEGMEVIVGPGAALYGADASNGVLSLQTKDPLTHPGTTVEISGGSRSYMDFQARQAGVYGNVGYKVAAEFQSVDDFENYLEYGGISERGVADWHNEVIRGEGAVVYYGGTNRFELSGGWSQTDGIGQTNVGRNQFVDWTYNFLQAEANVGDWYFNAYRNQSQSGESFALNRYVPAKAASDAGNLGLSHDSLVALSDWPSDGQLYAAEVQHRLELPMLANTQVVWGAQYRQDIVSSDRQWLTDALTGEDLSISTYGAYAQAEVPITSRLRAIGAARYDDHENYDAQFSPKLGLLFSPVPEQTLRVTWNRAFKSPTILQTNFHIPDFVVAGGFGYGVYGNTEGVEVRDGSGTVLAAYDPIEPEHNDTYEVGWKALLGNRVFMDIAGYYSDYENFFSPLTTINLVAAGQTAYIGGSSTPVTGPSGDQSVLTYFNLGSATVYGLDAGARVLLNPNLSLSGTLSYITLDDIEGIDIRTATGAPDSAKIRELSSLNAPEIKYTFGATMHDVANFDAGLSLRHVDEYRFASGINAGLIPGFTTVDLNASYRLPWFNTSLLLGVNNLFTCVADVEDTPGDEGGCGFDEKHIEMINMPAVGTMLYLGARVHRQ